MPKPSLEKNSSGTIFQITQSLSYVGTKRKVWEVNLASTVAVNRDSNEPRLSIGGERKKGKKGV